MIGKKSPLHEWHAANGARFVEFGGWQLPEVYGSSVEQEYATLHNGAAVIDLCHEARYRVEGPDAAAFLNNLLTLDTVEMAEGTVRFGYLCNDRGGILDGFQVFRDKNYFLLLGTGVTRPRTLEWLTNEATADNGHDVKVADVSQIQSQIGLLGPGASAVLERSLFSTPLTLHPGRAAGAVIEQSRCLVIRRMAGGYDIVLGSVYLQAAWERVIEVVRAMGSRPVGHAAREILRLESGVPQYGLEIDEDTTPLEVGHGTSVDFRKPVFRGRRALMHSVSAEFQRMLVAMRVEMNRPLDMEAEIIADGFPIGRITSFAISPMLRCKLALGFVSGMKPRPGTFLAIRNRDGQACRAEVVRPGNIATPVH